MTTLLIVEADILARAPLAAYLRECGFRVVEAASALEARMLVVDEDLAIDVVLAKIGEPAHDGFALASWIRQRQPRIQLVLAGSVDAAAKKAGDLCEEEASVSKPYDHQLVLDRIRRAIAARERNIGSGTDR